SVGRSDRPMANTSPRTMRSHRRGTVSAVIAAGFAPGRRRSPGRRYSRAIVLGFRAAGEWRARHGVGARATNRLGPRAHARARGAAPGPSASSGAEDSGLPAQLHDLEVVRRQLGELGIE